VQDARKQLDNEKKCLEAARDGKLEEAVRHADAGIADYPNATLVRYCKLNVLVRRKASNQDLIAMADEILAIDPASKAALAVAADAHKAEGNMTQANELLVRLLATDPTNANLATQVVDQLAASRDFAKAKEIVLKAINDNPGDVDLVALGFKILSAAGDYKPAIAMGEEMVQMDTSLADLGYFQRLSALYAADSQPQKASEAAARGTRKFPNDAGLWQFYAQTLKNAGQVQQSIAAAKRALEINPKIPNGWTQVAVAYNELNMPDSALLALRQAKAAGDDADQVGGFALSIGNRFYRAAVGEEPKKAASFELALPYLHFADSTVTDMATRTNAKFLIGVSSYYVASTLATGLQASKSCDEARAAQAAATNSTIYTQAGGRSAPDAAGQILGALGQLTPYLDQSIKTLCK
jgi:tetratricopeptide (TPR) repeat protein